MNGLVWFVERPEAQALATALIHFLWQGAAIAALAFGALRLVQTASGRYAVAVGALAAMLVAPVVTVGVLLASPDRAVTAARRSAAVPVAADRASGDVVPVPAPPVLSTPPVALPVAPAPASSPVPFGQGLVLLAWLTGVSLLSARLLGGWIVARRLTARAVRPAPEAIQVLVRRVAAHLALERIVRVCESSAVSVPMIVGWMKPVVLLPASALSGLTPGQIEALVAHELAHVRRHDYLVNLVQSAVETLLFYHPAVWWLSRRIRAEREHCCDDLAVGVSDRLTYATALAELARLNVPAGVALAATDGSLTDRVRRILGQPRREAPVTGGWIASLCVVFALGVAIPAAVPAGATDNGADGQSAGTATTQGAGVASGVGSGVATGIGSGVSGGVASGTSAGVAGGIASGTSAGVATGIASGTGAGVAGGVASGVSGGMASGISAGTPAGVAGGVMGAAEAGLAVGLQSGQVDPRTTADVEARMAAVRARMAALERTLQTIQQRGAVIEPADPDSPAAELARKQAELQRQVAEQNYARERDQVALERQRAQMDHQSESQRLTRELEMARQRLDETQGLVDKGLATLQSANEARQKVMALEQELRAVETQSTMAEQQAAIRLRQAEQALDAQQRQADINRQLDALARSQNEPLRAQNDRLVLEAQRDLEALRREYSDLVQLYTEQLNDPTGRHLSGTTLAHEAADQARAIRASDLLRVTIQGEPDLPRFYDVDDQGAIRIPLLGTLKVAGSTPAQVQDQIRRFLVERRLATSPVIEVRIWDVSR
ncbi:MAG: M56 family metallopeptidase [Vicinamibacterales bacterium]